MKILPKLLENTIKNRDYKYNFDSYRDMDGTMNIPDNSMEDGQKKLYYNTSR